MPKAGPKPVDPELPITPEDEAELVASLKRHAKSDPKIAIWLLERGVPDRWGKPTEKAPPKPKPVEPKPVESDPFADELPVRRGALRLAK